MTAAAAALEAALVELQRTAESVGATSYQITLFVTDEQLASARSLPCAVAGSVDVRQGRGVMAMPVVKIGDRMTLIGNGTFVEAPSMGLSS